MKSFILMLAGILFGSVCYSKTEAQFIKNIVLTVGDRAPIKVISKVIVAKQKVISIQESGAATHILGLKPGWTQLKVDDQLVEVSVLTLNQRRTLLKLENFVKTSLGLHVFVDKGEVVLSGQLFSMLQFKKIYELCNQSNCNFKNQIKVDTDMTAQVVKWVNQLLTQSGYPIPRIIFSPFWYAHFPMNEIKKNRLAEMLNALGIRVEYSVRTLAIKPMVKVQIMIMEIKKNKLESSGIVWPSQFSAQVIPEGLAWDPGLGFSAQSFEQNGTGKVIANPTLLTRSGAEAQFMAGGELPVRMMNLQNSSVVWKKYGLFIKLLPKADFSGRMSVQIEAEMSSLDMSVQLDGVPGIKVNKIKSHFDLTESRIIALSGLVKAEEAIASQGLMGFNKIPIFGDLFSSNDFRSDTTEMVVLVRPEIVY